MKSYSYVWTGTLYRVSLHVWFKYLMVFLPHVQYLPVWAKGLMLCNFSNNTGSSEELFSCVGLLGLNIMLILMCHLGQEVHQHSWY